MMEGYKTWTGIVLTLLGFLGVGEIVGQENLTDLINTLAQVVGLIVACYGNYKSHQKIEKLKQ